MVQIEKLTKRFGEKILFQDYSLEIQRGEFVAFAGVSGCGKTTLLNMIGSIEPVDSGKIVVDGIDLQKKRNQAKYLQKKVGFLFQNFALVDHKTVKENLKLVKNDCRSSVSIEDALEAVDMQNKLMQPVYTLSGGEQQRIALARLMIKKCDLILADEPTGSLDKENAKQVLDILKQLNTLGKTIIIVTHDLSVQEQVQRVIKL